MPLCQQISQFIILDNKMNQQKNILHQQHISYNQNGQSKIINQITQQTIAQGFIKIIRTQKIQYQKEKQLLYTDKEFTVSLEELTGLTKIQKAQIVLKRLSMLYPRKHQPELFNETIYPQSIKLKSQNLPHFINEIQLFHPFTFRRLFLTHKISENGRYQILINRDGIFQTQVIDDFVPIYAETEESIWQMDLLNPWQIIIAKLWAKIKGGYLKLKQSKPFEFIEYFTQSNWKYFNLTTSGLSFLNFYKNRINQKSQIILKSKNSNYIDQSGLISGKVCYQILGIQAEEINQKMLYFIFIKTLYPHSWTGKCSIFDKEVRKRIEKLKEEYKLCHTFVLNQKDFLNLFAAAYVTIKNKTFPYYSNFYHFVNEQDSQTAKYFKIVFEKEGEFNFCIKQPKSNCIKKSNVLFKQENEEQIEDNKRFPSLKYLLSRKIESSKDFLSRTDQSNIFVSMIKESISKFQSDYNPLQYESYEVNYNAGFAKSNAHFIRVIPGTYILRIEGEPVPTTSQFIIHYSSQQNCQLREIAFSEEDAVKFVNENIISMSSGIPKKTGDKYLAIQLGNCFQTLGFGFVVVKINKKSPYTLMIQVDQKKLQSQGYVLKFHDQKQSFKYELKLGQSIAFALEKLENRKQYRWPIQFFKVYKIE